MLNPLVFALASRKSTPASPANDAEPDLAPLVPTALTGHSVIIGYGRVGGAVAAGLSANGEAILVVEDDDDLAIAAQGQGIETLRGNAADIRVLDAAALDRAGRLFVAIPNAFEAGRIVERARQLSPTLDIVARAHSDAEVEHLTSLGASDIVMGEREIARHMLDRARTPTTPPPQAVAPVHPDERPILEDAELALLRSIRRHDIWPGEAISKGQLLSDGDVRLFPMDRLDAAFETLKAKACLQDWGDGRVSPTRVGLLSGL